MAGTKGSFTITDRRNNSGRNADNRQRFFKRNHAALREAVQRALLTDTLTHLAGSGPKKVQLRNLPTHEPYFHYDGSGIHDLVIMGNREFVVGDRIPKEQKGQGQGRPSAGDSGTGEDDFVFTISLTNEEFMDLVFEDLELPNMAKRTLTESEDTIRVRDGFTASGSPTHLDHKQTIMKSRMRRRVFTTSAQRLITEAQERLEALEGLLRNGPDAALEEERAALVERMRTLHVRMHAIPHFSKNDTRYRHWDREPIPISKAVMFHVMDVSGSMGEWEKEMAKRFYLVLRQFLKREYDRVEPVYIVYHTEANEVQEEEFFYGRKTGGTLTSHALKLVDTVIQERFPLNEWNVYICHSSDGDNWETDNRATQTILEDLLPHTQYYAYVELLGGDRGGRPTTLWTSMESLASAHSDMFAVAQIKHARDIFPVFRGLFQKRGQS